MTECSQEVFRFAPHFSRRVEAGFTAGRVSGDGGALLLRQTERKIDLVKRVAACFTDQRRQDRVEHRLGEMLAQRIFSLALGYEDLNDHEQLRHDPLLAVLSGKREIEAPLAGKSTLNRLELPGGAKRYHKIDYEPEKVDALLCDLFIESHMTPPEQVVLDLDATDVPLYGHQPERLFAYRLSTEEMKGNQLRLYLSALAYTLVEALRRLALKGTAWAQAQVDTIRLKLFKIGAVVRISVRRVLLELSSAYAWKHLYTHAFEALSL